MKRCVLIMLSAVLLMALFCSPAQATGSKLIALTFDDGPGQYTDQLLDGLKARGAKATFFVLGDCVQYHQDTVARAFQEGHQIGEHSFSHPDLTLLSRGEIQKQFQDLTKLLDHACGSGTRYMVRPPFGKTNDVVEQAVGAPLIQWNVDPLDWACRDAQEVKRCLVNHASDGAILLAHDLYSTTVDGALAAVDDLQAQGYEFVTVSELFRRRGVALKNGAVYYRCSSTGKDLGAISAPKISVTPKGEQYLVTLSAQEGVPIYYTIDGTPVRQDSTQYTGPFMVSTPVTIQATAAYDLNGSRSETVFQTLTQPQAQPPVLSLEEDGLTFSCSTPEASVYYTVTGVQDTSEQRYDGAALSLDPGVTVTAYAKAPGFLQSAAATAVYSPSKNFFCDVFPDAWYFDAVDSICAEGIMECTEPGCFQPDSPVTRGQLVMALYHASGDPVPGGHSPFQDVSTEDACADAVLWAYSNGIVLGYDDRSFRPQNSITRQELAVFLHRFLRWNGTDLPRPDLSGYRDIAGIAHWARKPVGELTAGHILTGSNGYFDPTATASRGQTAALLCRTLEYCQQSISASPVSE